MRIIIHIVYEIVIPEYPEKNLVGRTGYNAEFYIQEGIIFLWKD